jgi:hypothetical protein
MVNPWQLPTTRSFLELLITCGMPLNVFLLVVCIHNVTDILCPRHTHGIECSRVLDTLPISVLKRTRGLPTRVILHLSFSIVFK